MRMNPALSRDLGTRPVLRRSRSLTRAPHAVDAIHKKKNTVVMILANPFGGMHSTLAGLLSHLDKKKGVDYTHYGENSTKSFYTHHMNAISVACVTGEAEAINWAISRAETRFSGATA